jgi:uncharacterized protein (TIGR02246 family)
MSDHIDQIAAMFERFAATWNSNDATALGRFFTPDGVLVNPFGERADGQPAVTAMYMQYFGTVLQGSTTSVRVDHVRGVEGQHAFVDADQTIRGADGRVLFDLRLAALLKRDGSAWRVVDARPHTVTARPV